ncbi:MAG: right-handed parallel beta-helix repeat-containing protein [Candidatus Sumerlaeota bacterium]|nr:right-handed parallel beta-helix repeat-containing protein [Candidatus Sumerlaeota bacterium]
MNRICIKLDMSFISTLLSVMLSASATQAKTIIVNPALASAADSNPGSEAQPLKTINRAAEIAQPGDVVRIHAGIYREKVTINHSGTKEQPIRFEAAQGAQPVITGADLLTGWSKDKDKDNSYSIPWTHKLYQGDDHNPGGAEQVFVNRKLFRKAPSLAEMKEGMFFVDLNAKRLHLYVPPVPNDSPIEGSTRSEIWIVNGAYVQTRGLCFRYAANRAQQGMTQFKGAFDVAEDCVFEWANSSGASFQGEDITVSRSVFQDCGQQGYSGSHAHRLRLDGCTVQRNNNKEYPRGWEAGGNKICQSRGVIYENCRFLNNYGNGIWFDISNQDATIRNCLIADNEDAGIFYEISYGLHAHDNVIVGNGRRPSKGSWGANGGLCLSSSPGCLIERNLIIGNYQGFCFREQIRTTPPVDGSKGAEVPIWVHDEVVRNNLIVNNTNAQVQGWFDIASERHWPKAMQTGKAEGAKVEGAKAKDDMAAGYQAKKDGVPPGLALEDLKITLQGNYYAMEPKQVFFIWGTNWKRKQEFKDIPSLTKALGLEDPRSRILPPLPVDIPKRDFRLPKDHPVFAAGVYPQGKVPDCILGARER